MKKKTIYINGRFLSASLTGVQRSACELLQALDQQLEEDPQLRERFTFRLLHPGLINMPLTLKNIAIKQQGFLKGNLWEQLELPCYTRGRLLLSLCSVGPILKQNQFLLIHDVSPLVNPSYFSKAFRAWYRMAIPLLGARCRRILTVSEFSKNELVRYADVAPEKIEVIYNAAEHLHEVPQPGELFIKKIQALKPYGLAVSSLGANKNFAGLSAVLSQVRLPVNLLIAGKRIGGLAVAQENSQAVYLGYVSDAELKYLYQQAELFIFPSFYEGFGIPPLEAMALGCPVIASNTSSLPEVLGDAAAYFDPHNTANMAGAISTLINDPERLQVLKTAGYKQSAQYSWKKSARQLIHLLLHDKQFRP